MTTVTVVTYSDEHFDGVDALWKEAFPDDPPHNHAAVSIPKKLAVQPHFFLVAVESENVVGSIMAGYDGHRGWLYSVAVLESRRRLGIGTKLVWEAEQLLHDAGCTKINLQIRAGNAEVMAFYRRLGFDVEERVSMGKRIG